MPNLSDPGLQAALFRNGCMFLALLGTLRITWIAFRRYNTKPTPSAQWQLALLGGFLATAAYVAILAVSGAPTGDSFMVSTSSGPAATIDYVYLLKAGFLLILFGAFSATKPPA